MVQIIVLAAVAFFLFWRLRSVLGSRQGFEKLNKNVDEKTKSSKINSNIDDKVINIKSKNIERKILKRAYMRYISPL